MQTLLDQAKQANLTFEQTYKLAETLLIQYLKQAKLYYLQTLTNPSEEQISALFNHLKLALSDLEHAEFKLRQPFELINDKLRTLIVDSCMNISTDMDPACKTSEISNAIYKLNTRITAYELKLIYLTRKWIKHSTIYASELISPYATNVEQMLEIMEDY